MAHRVYDHSRNDQVQFTIMHQNLVCRASLAMTGIIYNLISNGYIYVCRMIKLGKLEPINLVQERMKIYDNSLVEKGLQKGLRKGRQEALASLALAMELKAQGSSFEEIHTQTQLPRELLARLF